MVANASTLETSQLHSNGEANTAGYSSKTMLKSRGWQGNGHSLCNLRFDILIGDITTILYTNYQETRV